MATSTKAEHKQQGVTWETDLSSASAHWVPGLNSTVTRWAADSRSNSNSNARRLLSGIYTELAVSRWHTLWSSEEMQGRTDVTFMVMAKKGKVEVAPTAAATTFVMQRHIVLSYLRSDLCPLASGTRAGSRKQAHCTSNWRLLPKLNTPSPLWTLPPLPSRGK